ncbi:hypothetical protein ACSSS7_002197 [Eimeria intestinalis]
MSACRLLPLKQLQQASLPLLKAYELGFRASRRLGAPPLSTIHGGPFSPAQGPPCNMQKLEGANRLAGCGPQLLRSFRLRTQLQLLPAADLRFAAERKRHHLQRLQEAEPEATGAAAAVAGGSPLKASDSKGSAVHALRALLFSGAVGGEQTLLNEEEEGGATIDSSERGAASLLALRAYRLHFVSSLQQDLGRLGWGEGGPLRERPSQGAPALNSGDSPLFAATQQTLERLSSSTFVPTTSGAPEGARDPTHFSRARQEEAPPRADSGRGARASEALQEQRTDSTTPFASSRRGGLYSYMPQQQQQKQYGAFASSYATADLATESSSVSLLPHAGSAGSFGLQQQQQQQQQASSLDEEVLALREQVVELQLQQQQQQHECASAAVAAAALRTRVQQLLEENAALRLQCHGTRGRRGLPLASATKQQQQQHQQQQQEEQESAAAGEALLEQEQHESHACLQQKLDVCRRELMLLAEQNARLRLHAAGGPPST